MQKKRMEFYTAILKRITGLGPATSTLARLRSTKWAKSAYIKSFAEITSLRKPYPDKTNDLKETRTPDL